MIIMIIKNCLLLYTYLEILSYVVNFHTQMSSSQSDQQMMVFTSEKNDTSNQKPRRCVSTSFAPKFQPFIGACSLQSHFADIQRKRFFEILSFVLLWRKKTVESRKHDGRLQGMSSRNLLNSILAHRGVVYIPNEARHQDILIREKFSLNV